MKVLLRDEDKRLYYGTGDRWVADPDAALDFEVLEKAGEKAAEQPTRALSVVLKYESPECELALNPVFCSSKVKTDQPPPGKEMGKAPRCGHHAQESH